MSNFINLILSKENQESCLFLGFFIVAAPFLYFLGIKSEWFHEWFLIVLTIQFFFGLLFILVGFGSTEPSEERKSRKAIVVPRVVRKIFEWIAFIIILPFFIAWAVGWILFAIAFWVVSFGQFQPFSISDLGKKFIGFFKNKKKDNEGDLEEREKKDLSSQDEIDDRPDSPFNPRLIESDATSVVNEWLKSRKDDA